MRSRTLGKPGLEVSELGLGCMGLSVAYADPVEEAAAIRLIRDAIDRGITFFDTAQLYADNELLVGRAVAGRRQDLRIATKFGFRLDATHRPCGFDSTPRNIRTVCEASLRRLGVEVIDLFYQHRVDPEVPMADVAGTVGDLVREGKVRHFGLSEAGCEAIAAAHAVHPVTALQSEYSLWSRDIEREILPLCRRLGIGFVAFGALGRGFLAGAAKTMPANDRRHALPRWQGEALATNLDLLGRLERIAAVRGVSTAQLSLAWVLAQGEDIVPIPGTTRTERLEENIAAADIRLTAEETALIGSALPADAVRDGRPEPSGGQASRVGTPSPAR